MKATKLITLLFLFFSLAPIAIAQETIKVPTHMFGLMDDPSQQGKEFYTYPGGKILNIKVQADASSKKTISGFINYLWYLYQNDKKEEFKSLFTEKALTKLKELSDQQFLQEWNTIKSQPNPYLKSHFSYKNGHIVNWFAGKIPRALYLIPSNGTFKIDFFHADKDDIAFHNRSLYFTYAPLKINKAKVVKGFSLKSKDYSISLDTTYKNSRVTIFKKEDTWDPKVITVDNSVGKFRFDDMNPQENKVKIQFEQSHFTQNKQHELLILESNYPIKEYPLSLAPKGNLVIK
jgi:hypothetical protein